MRAVILTIGDEILVGQITDTNSAWLSKQLTAEGIEVTEKRSVRDDDQAITNALQECASRADLLILTGGLGPTPDDRTLSVLSHWLQIPLKLDEAYFEKIRAYFAKRGPEVVEYNRNQALRLAAGEVLPNPKGSARGSWVKHGQVWIACLPGVPYEMKEMTTVELIPRIRSEFSLQPIQHEYIMTAGLGESTLASRIQGIEQCFPPGMTLGYYPELGVVKLRLSASASKVSAEQLRLQADQIAVMLGDHVFAREEIRIEEMIARLLQWKKMKLALAESCTGGYLSHLITAMPGSSVYYAGGVVSYSNEMKSQVLGVNPQLIREQGAVSEAVVQAMAEGIKQQTGADYAIAISGVAGPGGGNDEKPVGTVCIAILSPQGVTTRTVSLFRTRMENIRGAAHTALFLLYKAIHQQT